MTDTGVTEIMVRGPGELEVTIPARQIVNREQRALVDTETGEINPFVRLDRYGKQGLVAPRWPDAIATISAGEKVNGKPVVARDLRIRLHDTDNRAPGLKTALAVSGGKVLRIGLPFDDIRQCLQQHWSRYTATRMEMWGDLDKAEVSTVTKWGQDKDGNKVPEAVERATYYAGTPGYKAEMDNPNTKLSWSMYFTLAEWLPEDMWPDGVPAGKPIMSDGLGFYRVRSSSPNGLDKILDRLELVYKLTRGHLQNIPLELSLTNEERNDRFGMRRTVPLWTVIFKPPPGVALDRDSWIQMALAARSASPLMLPAPRDESFDMAEEDFDSGLVEVTEDDLADLMGADMPAAPNGDHWRHEFFGNVGKDSSLQTEDGRAAWLFLKTGGRYSSLAKAIAGLTNSQMQEIVVSAAEHAAEERSARKETSNTATPPAVVSGAPAASPAAGASDLDDLRRKAAAYDRMMAAQYPDEPVKEGAHPGFTGTVQGVTGEQMTAHINGPGNAVVEPDLAAVVADLTEIIDRDDSAPELESSPTSNSTPEAGSLTICSSCQLRQIGQEGDNCGTETCLGKLETPSEEMGEGADWDAEGARQARSEAVLKTLLQTLRPDVVGGEVFSCARCGKQIGSVAAKDGVYPARQWLSQLAEQGIDEPLCKDDALQVIRDRNKKKERTPKA